MGNSQTKLALKLVIAATLLLAIVSLAGSFGDHIALLAAIASAAAVARHYQRLF